MQRHYVMVRACPGSAWVARVGMPVGSRCWCRGFVGRGFAHGAVGLQTGLVLAFLTAGLLVRRVVYVWRAAEVQGSSRVVGRRIGKGPADGGRVPAPDSPTFPWQLGSTGTVLVTGRGDSGARILHFTSIRSPRVKELGQLHHPPLEKQGWFLSAEQERKEVRVAWEVPRP